MFTTSHIPWYEGLGVKCQPQKTKQVVRNKASKTDKYEILKALKIQLKEAASYD